MENTFEYETAYELLIRLKADELLLSTCLPSLNNILQLHPGKCYEIDGNVSSGKTQICYSIALKFLQTKKTGKIGWISAIPLRTDHLSHHILPKNLNDQSVELDLDRIICKHVEKISELRESLNILSENLNVHLVVVENIDALLHDTAYDREVGKNIQTDVVERIRKLTRAGITVLVTNHITHWRGYPSPALGTFWASQITNRFFVEKPNEDSNERVISTKVEGTGEALRASFRIGQHGLEDVVNN